MNKKNSSFGSVLIGILSLLFIVAVVGFVFKFTNGLNEDLKTFYLEHNGKQIVATDSQMTFDTESAHRFDCKYISNPDNATFNLKVIPNVTEETDFSYTVDGNSYKWSEIEDLTTCFNLDKQANYFIISFPADFSIQGVLNSLYPESQVVISDTLYLYQYYFTLHVSNYNGKINYYIDFNVSDVDDCVALINQQEEQIVQLEYKINELEKQKADLEASSNVNSSEIVSLRNQIDVLTKEKEALEITANAYKESALAYSEDNYYVVFLEVDNKIYTWFRLARNAPMFDVLIPESDDYEFNCWTLNGEPVNLQGYALTKNTVFVADLTYSYTISFVVDGVTVKTERVIENNLITPPTNPKKSGYTFIGWVDSSNVLMDFTTYTACEKTTFNAEFTLNTINVSFGFRKKASENDGGGAIVTESVDISICNETSYLNAVAYGYGTISPSSVVLSVENQNAVITFTLDSGHIYSGYEVEYSSTLTKSYPFEVSVSGETITLTLNSAPSTSENYTFLICIIRDGIILL